MFNIDIQRAEHTLTVVVAGRLDSTNSEQFEEQLVASIAGEDTGLAMDVSGLEYISSSGLKAVLHAARVMRRQRGRFAVGGASGGVREVITISGFDRVVPMHDSIAEAQAAVQARR